MSIDNIYRKCLERQELQPKKIKREPDRNFNDIVQRGKDSIEMVEIIRQISENFMELHDLIKRDDNIQ